MTGLPIEQSCFWLARRPPRPVTPFEGSAEADVVVVGAGLTGLWTALFIKQLDPGAEVVVLEQEVAAYGASGRNAGILAETVDHEDARRSVAAAEHLGLDSYRYLGRDEFRARLDSPLYLGGVQVRTGGLLDPVKLVDGLKGEAQRLGVRVYERSRVESMDRAGAGVELRTAAGALHARCAVLATSAYTHRILPHVTRRFIPLYDYILVSDPLTPAQRETIGWRERQGVTDGRSFFNYYRLTSDDRILWGTSEAAYYPGNRVDAGCDHSPPHYAELRASFRRHFPALASLDFPYAWGGPICSTTRLTPFFGRALDRRVVYGLGYTGHGLGTTRIGGRILAHLALDRQSDLLDLAMVRRKPFPYPPEPLRTWAVAAITRALRRVDEGKRPSAILRLLGRAGIGFSS